MNKKQLIESFLSMEKELELFSVKIDDVYYWERIRLGVLNDLLYKMNVIGQAHTEIELRNGKIVTAVVEVLKHIVKRNPLYVNKSDILFIGHPRRKLGKDNKWHDIYCDPLIDELVYSYAYFEKPYLPWHLYPAATENLYYLDLPFLISIIVQRLRLVRVKLSNSDCKMIRMIEKKIFEIYKIRIDLLNKVQKKLLKRKSIIWLFKQLFKKVSPRVIIVVCSYGLETYIEAAKSLGIIVVELQHGLLSANHLGYHFPYGSKETFPDYFLSFGDYWNNVAQFPIDSDRIISVGYPYMEKEVAKYVNAEKREQIIFISQGTIGNELSRIALDLSRNDNLKYNIIYKLHPGEYSRWRKEYPWLIDSGIQVIDNEDYPLYKLFAESMIQVGVHSTALYEGLVFGLKTFIVPLNTELEGMEYLVSEGLAVQIDNVKQLANELINFKKPDSTQIDYFFKRDALYNIKRFLEEII